MAKKNSSIISWLFVTFVEKYLYEIENGRNTENGKTMKQCFI